MLKHLRMLLWILAIFNGLGALFWMESRQAYLLGMVNAIFAVLQIGVSFVLKRKKYMPYFLWFGLAILIQEFSISIYKIQDENLFAGFIINFWGMMVGLLLILQSRMGHLKSAGLVASSIPKHLSEVGEVPQSPGLKSKILALAHFEVFRNLANPTALMMSFISLAGLIWLSTFLLKYSVKIHQLTHQISELKNFIWGDWDDWIYPLLENYAPLGAILFAVIMMNLPILILVLSSDQVATEIGQKHIRFLVPKLSRKEVLSIRFGLFAFFWTAIMVPIFALIIAMVIWVDPQQSSNANNLIFLFKISLTLALYALPFIAMMNAADSLSKGTGMALAMALGYWVIVNLFTHLGILYWKGLAYFHWLLPTQLFESLIDIGSMTWFGALFLTLIYTLGFGTLGYFVFARRDL